ncbi:MAG: cation:proton antiporter [Aquificae bacterium]|nr:cation:proton antiporter [Aquificota bacterium]
MENQMLVLILVSLGAFLVPFAVPFFKLPVAVGELLYGVFLAYLFARLGVGGEALLPLEVLAFLGFSLLMFLAGLEIDWNKLETLNRREKLVILAVVATDFLLAALWVKLLNLSGEWILILGALGIGLMLSVVKELELPERFTQAVLITGSLGEVATLLGLTGYDLYLAFGLSKEFVFHTLLVGLFGLFFLLLLKLIKLLIWYFPDKFAALVVEENKAAVDVRASFALMLTFMAFAYLVHVEPILGAFIAGTLFGFIFREKESIEHKLSALGYGFLIPFFFIQVGLSFDPRYLLSEEPLKLALLLWGLLFSVKLLSSLWFFLLGFKPREVLLASFLFSFPFTVLIAVGKILYEKGVWGSGELVSVILLTVLTSVAFPFLAKTFRG